MKRLIKIFVKTGKSFGRTSKGSRKGIASLRSTSGSCVTSTKGNLEVLREHYERLSTALLMISLMIARKSINKRK